MAKSKQFTRPPKKQKPKAAVPDTADDFQEAADREEEAGGKHRVGDPAKSARAFIRALEIYDRGLQKHPSDFDLAYNKARLQFEIAQQPQLIEHIGLPLNDLLQQTLQSHRYALKLNEESADTLFNLSQVLTALAEQVSGAGDSFRAVPLLQESLELLSACLSRQEMLLEQRHVDLEDMDEGGVRLDLDEKRASTSGSDVSEQTALIETPITANDLLDTVHASLSALTTLAPLVEQSALGNLGDMAHTLTEKRAINYISTLPEDDQARARFSTAVDRAIFIAAFADAQYSFYMIDLDTYMDRLAAFDVIGKESSAHALCVEAEARTEFSLSALDRFEGSSGFPGDVCWKQLVLVQELYAKATKLDTDDAKERKAEVYESKGNVELLRHRLVTTSGVSLADSVMRSAQTLTQNAQTYFKGAAQLARADGDSDLELKAKSRWIIAADITATLYGSEPREQFPFEGNTATTRDEILRALEDYVDEGYIGGALGEEVKKRIRQ